MLVDTHAHLNAEPFDTDRAEVIQRALDNGVTRIINIGFNRETITTSLQLAEQYPFIYSSVGWHPVDAEQMTAADLSWLEQLCTHPKVVAIGEVGLDYYWKTSSPAVQHTVLREQIQLARQVGLPLIIHNREAHEDVVAILEEEKAAEVGGVMHCFSGDWDMAKRCLNMNFYLSFGGPITFKNAHLPKEVLASVPLDRLLLETDAPYLAPHPFRGKRNESSYVTLIAEAAAEIKQLSLAEIAKQTTENAVRLFNIK